MHPVLRLLPVLTLAALSGCVAGHTVGMCGSSETICDDGRDNDCDGLVDCYDPDCRGSGGACGGSCMCDDGDPCTTDTCDPAGVCVHTADPTCAGCPTGRSPCGDSCVDLMTDTSNCGACGNACVAGVACMGGVCGTGGCVPVAESCNDGVDNDCDGLVDCYDPDCGMAGTCGTTCPTGWTRCDPAAGCVNLQTDAANCGACGSRCPMGSTCYAGSCTGGGCIPSPEVCDDRVDNDCDGLVDCYDVECARAPVCTGTCTCNDVNLCTTDACSMDGSCVFTPISCDDANPCTVDSCSPSVGCVHTADPSCGVCPMGQTACGSAGGVVRCVDLMTDPSNCGGCGNVCRMGVSCIRGVCSPTP